jgi:hypothetical protein
MAGTTLRRHIFQFMVQRNLDTTLARRHMDKLDTSVESLNHDAKHFAKLKVE